MEHVDVTVDVEYAAFVWHPERKGAMSRLGVRLEVCCLQKEDYRSGFRMVFWMGMIQIRLLIKNVK